MSHDESDLNDLLARLAKAREEEAKLTAVRRDLEDAVILAAQRFATDTDGSCPTEGTVRLHADDAVAAVLFQMDRKFDEDVLDSIYTDISDAVREKLVRIKREVGVTEYKRICKDGPAELRVAVQRAVISKPARPRITITPKE